MPDATRRVDITSQLRMERTAVVSHPLPPPSASWASNPLVVMGGLSASFIVGAGLVFVMARSLMPQQPSIMQALPVAPTPPPLKVTSLEVAPGFISEPSADPLALPHARHGARHSGSAKRTTNEAVKKIRRPSTSPPVSVKDGI
jgi:hypothetical protein